MNRSFTLHLQEAPLRRIKQMEREVRERRPQEFNTPADRLRRTESEATRAQWFHIHRKKKKKSSNTRSLNAADPGFSWFHRDQVQVQDSEGAEESFRPTWSPSSTIFVSIKPQFNWICHQQVSVALLLSLKGLSLTVTVTNSLSIILFVTS